MESMLNFHVVGMMLTSLSVTILHSGSNAGLNLLAQELDHLWRVEFCAHYRFGIDSGNFGDFHWL